MTLCKLPFALSSATWPSLFSKCLCGTHPFLIIISMPELITLQNKTLGFRNKWNAWVNLPSPQHGPHFRLNQRSMHMGVHRQPKISKDSLTLKRIFKKLESNPKLYSFGTETGIRFSPWKIKPKPQETLGRLFSKHKPNPCQPSYHDVTDIRTARTPYNRSFKKRRKGRNRYKNRQTCLYLWKRSVWL